MKETKSERIFKETRYMCRKHIEAWGYEVNPNGKAVGFNAVGGEEAVSNRTLNDIEKHLNSYRKEAALALKYEVINSEEYKKRQQIANMIESTIENNRKSLQEMLA